MSLILRKTAPIKERLNKNKSFYNSQTILRDELKKALEQYKNENGGKFSLNDFSKKTGISKPNLSAFFNEKLVFNKKVVLGKLQPHLSKKVLDRYLKEIDFESLKSETRPDKSVDIFSVNEKGEQYLTKAQKEFSEDPYSFAILMAFDLEDYEPNVEWFSKRFYLSKDDIFHRLELLLRVGMIERDGGFYKSTGKRPVSIDRKKNKCIIKHLSRLNDIHDDVFKKELFDGKNESKAYNDSWFFSLDPEDAEGLKNEMRLFIKKFQRKQIKSKPKEIYSLNIRFIPVTKF